jgi:hypothetical protein
MNVISNNLANVNTTGFKRDRAVFEDLLYQNIRQAGGQTSATTQAPTGLMLGTGVRVVATEKLHALLGLLATAAFLGRHPDFSPLPLAEAWAAGGLAGEPPGVGLYLVTSPAQHGTDGFFAAVLQRKA